jgi:hypothetical protein
MYSELFETIIRTSGENTDDVNSPEPDNFWAENRLFEQVLREMGRITVSIGCDILFPLFNKNITSNAQEIQNAIEKIYNYGKGGAVIFCSDNRTVMEKIPWLEAVFAKISELKNQEFTSETTLIKDSF